MAPVPTRAGPRFRRRRRAAASALLHILLRAPAVAAFAAPARSAPPRAARVAQSPRLAIASDVAEDVAGPAGADAVATLSELAGAGAGAGSTKTKFSPEDVTKYLAAIDGLPAPPAGLDVDGGWEYVPRDGTK